MADANIIKEEKEEAVADYKKRRQLKKKANAEEQAAGKEEQKAQESKEKQEKEAKEGSEESKEGKEKKVRKIETAEQLLFGKYSFSDIVVSDASLADYIVLTPMKYPNTFGRRKNKSYYFSHVNVVERLINKLMRGGTGKKIGGKVIRTEGRLQGKKIKVMHIVEEAFDIVNKQTGKNPIQVLVDAIENAAPIEDTTRVRYGGINYNVAVDVSSLRRLNVALKNIALAAITGSFKNRKRLAEALANELILASTKNPESYAIKKRVDAERMARSAR
jgi:small subunit ribosomal protein S7